MSGRGSPGCVPEGPHANPAIGPNLNLNLNLNLGLADLLPTGVLPPGALDWCVDLLQRAVAGLTRPPLGGPGAQWVIDRDLVACHLLAPWVIAAANELGRPPPPRPPVPAPGGGWVDADPGPADHDTWDRLQAVLRQDILAGATPPNAEQVARRAQEWRLPVTPYRAVSDTMWGHRSNERAALSHQEEALQEGWSHRNGSASPARGWAPLAGVTVIDLTVLWAGPLATWLLADLGARVIKIEPAVRPDGLRRGERPASAGPGDGALFVALDHGKEHRELDLRRRTDHDHFLELVSTADVVIDNFSRRVRPNLGIEPTRLAQVRPGLIDLSLRAFDAGGARADWVAHGGGVHAASGLALTGPGGVPQPAQVNYPDPVAGFTALGLLVGALRARQAGDRPPALVLSLEEAIRPLRNHHASPRRNEDAGDLWCWAIAAAGRATVLVDGCRGLPPPLRRAESASRHTADETTS